MNDISPPKPRKRPKQERSQQTVAAILDSCKKILIEQGEESLTPGKLEQVSGVAKGSIYQYFPNTDAIIASTIEREFEAYANRGLLRLQQQVKFTTLKEVIELFVDESVTWYRNMSNLHNKFYEQYLLHFNPGSQFSEQFGSFDKIITQISPLLKSFNTAVPAQEYRSTLSGMLRLMIWMFMDAARSKPEIIFNPSLKHQIVETALTYVSSTCYQSTDTKDQEQTKTQLKNAYQPA